MFKNGLFSHALYCIQLRDHSHMTSVGGWGGGGGGSGLLWVDLLTKFNASLKVCLASSACGHKF